MDNNAGVKGAQVINWQGKEEHQSSAHNSKQGLTSLCVRECLCVKESVCLCVRVRVSETVQACAVLFGVIWGNN